MNKKQEAIKRYMQMQRDMEFMRLTETKAYHIAYAIVVGVILLGVMAFVWGRYYG
jgi:hypothetical protein